MVKTNVKLKKNIAILAGGFSAERKISLQSAQIVLKNISKKYNPYLIIVDLNEWNVELNSNYYPVNKEDFTTTINKQIIKFDFAFIAIHGSPGEDGKLPLLFEKLHIPFSCSNSKASALTFNKYNCNTHLIKHNFNCSKSILIKKKDSINIQKIITHTYLPCFVKPNNSGSSFGISKVNNKEELHPAIRKAFKYDNEVIIESFLEGTEVTCGVHNFDSNLFAFPLTEIVSKNDFFDYEAKYQGCSDEITPARINDAITKEIQSISKNIYSLLNLNGIIRIDFIIVNDTPFIIEVNTIPGLSSESIIPKMAQSIGLSLEDLFLKIIENNLK